MDRRKIIIRQVIKYSIFVLSVFVLYVMQATPGFLSLFGIKPVLILPFCITLSMLDETPTAGIVYLIGGLLTDLSCTRLVGTFTLMLIITCLCGIIAVKFFFRPSQRNFYLFSFISMMVMLSVDFFFSFIMGGRFTAKLGYYFVNVVLVSAYSAVFSLVFNRFIDYINLRFLRFDAR